MVLKIHPGQKLRQSVSRCRLLLSMVACVVILGIRAVAAAAAPPSLLGLPQIAIPADNLQTSEKIALGERLFFDARLSGNGKISCASCHQPDRAFADNLKLAQGISGAVGTRNTPSLRNARFSQEQFWDGRRQSLEAQAGDPFVNIQEHGLRTHAQLLKLLQVDAGYRAAFRQVFGLGEEFITMAQVTQALASYVRTLPRGGSPFDEFKYGNKPEAISQAARRGYELFRGRARCNTCHVIGEQGASLTDSRYHGLGIGQGLNHNALAQLTMRVALLSKDQLDKVVLRDREVAALGRFIVTQDPKDIGSFKTPSLRNVALTAPYMHDGSVATLEEAVDLEIYYRGLEAGRVLVLTPAEKADLVEFLRSLTSPRTTVEHER